MKVSSLARARQLAAKHGLIVREHVSHPRGTRLNCVTARGEVLTLTINKRVPLTPKKKGKVRRPGPAGGERNGR